MRPRLTQVLKRLICQTQQQSQQSQCKCYNNINFRGVTFEEYKALRDNKNKSLCLYDQNDKFRVKIGSSIDIFPSKEINYHTT